MAGFTPATSQYAIPTGYIVTKNRCRNIIISDRENISLLEVEDGLYRHRQIMEAAVVARPNPVWGESPCLFVGEIVS